MNVGIGTESAQFLFWEYKNGIFVTVHYKGFAVCTWRAGPCLYCVISLMSVFCVHLLIYQQLQQLGMPAARSWAAPRQGRRYIMPWQVAVWPAHHSTPSSFLYDINFLAVQCRHNFFHVYRILWMPSPTVPILKWICWHASPTYWVSFHA